MHSKICKITALDNCPGWFCMSLESALLCCFGRCLGLHKQAVQALHSQPQACLSAGRQK